MTTLVGEPGPRRARVAELIVTHDGGRRRGSGYRVGADAVLTAAHVLLDAVSVTVRFAPDLPGEWSTAATDWWVDADSDLAVLSIPPRVGEEPVEATRFGRIGSRAAVLEAQAIGFPLWKLRNDDGTVPSAGDVGAKYRDSVQVTGSVAVLSNWREGTLEVVVEPPAGSDGPATGMSPWQGMSGAALWVGDRVVGVVARHHPGDGLARLAAARLDLAVERLDADRLRVLRKILPQLPKRAASLPDVIPASSAQQALTAYREQLADIAPPKLRDRGQELTELVRFCAGTEPYRWLQAGPWAGKSALLASFARFPPRGVDVVSFFITSRFAGQSDSDAFTEALLEQLAALVGEQPHDVVRSQARPGHLKRLLRQAARRSAEAHRRLLLVVDGLDEDTSGAGGVDRPSIAALLPAVLPAEVRVLVASRPHPDLPDDVPANHPLRTVTPIQLSESGHAQSIERFAKLELGRALRGSPSQQLVLGLITASGGGLARADVEHLMGWPPYELDALFNGRFGRTLVTRDGGGSGFRSDASWPTRSGDPWHPPAKVYLFAHETLREIAEEQYGASIAGFRDRLHAWADACRTRGWPADTSVYLLRGYTRMLASTGDLPRLLALATDRARHARLLDITGGDGVALSEITTAMDLAAKRFDFGALLLLAVARDNLAERNAHIPVELPAVWLTLGHPTRATSLANGIVDPEARTKALVLMVEAAYARGGLDRKRVVAKIERHAGRVADPELRDRVIAALAAAAATAGRRKHPARLLAGIHDPQNRLAAEASCATLAGDHDRAEALIGEVDSSQRRVRLLIELMAATGGDRARRLAVAARNAVDEISQPWVRESLLAALAAAVAHAGAPGLGEDLRQAIRDPQWKMAALTGLVRASATAGDHDRTRRLLLLAEQVTENLAAVAEAYAAAGDYDHAERLIAEVTEPRARAAAQTSLTAVVTAAGEHDRGERLATAIVEIGYRTHAIALVAGAIADHDRVRARELADAAESDARQIVDHRRWVHLLAGLSSAAADLGDQVRAARLAAAADDPLSRTATQWQPDEVEEPQGEPGTHAKLAEALAANGEHDEAVRVADAITDSYWRDWAWSASAVSIARAGDHVRAERLVRKLADPAERARALARIADATPDAEVTRRLAVELLTSRMWHAILPSAGRLVGAKLAEIIDVLLEQSVDRGSVGEARVVGQ